MIPVSYGFLRFFFYLIDIWLRFTLVILIVWFSGM